MLTTVAMDHLTGTLTFVRLAPSILDMRHVSELSDLHGIHENVAKPEYMASKVA